MEYEIITFKKRVNKSIEINKHKFKFLTVPKKWSEDVEIKCKKCGHTETRHSNGFFKNYTSIKKCKNCEIKNFNNETYTIEKASLIFKERGYELLEKEYINCKIKMKYWCPKCETEQSMSLDNMKRGKGCPDCANNNMSLKDEDIIKKANSLGFKVLKIDKQNDKNAQEKIDVYLKCNEGHTFSVNWSYLRGKKEYECKVCRGYHAFPEGKTQEQHKDEVDEYIKDNDLNYEFIEAYNVYYITNKSIWLKLKCKEHGEFKVEKASFMKRLFQRCPICTKNASKGEIKISEILNKYNIKFTREYTFKDCRNVLPLPFDFYLHDYNILCEFQGQEHYRSIKYFGGEKKFKQRLKNDKIKKDYCNSKKDLFLLEIPFWDYDKIEGIIKEAILNE